MIKINTPYKSSISNNIYIFDDIFRESHEMVSGTGTILWSHQESHKERPIYSVQKEALTECCLPYWYITSQTYEIY